MSSKPVISASAPTAPSRRVKVTDIAKAAGVSQALVYTFLSGRYYGNGNGAKAGVGIAVETQGRIAQACRDLEYEPENLEIRMRIYPELGDFVFLLSSEVKEGIANAYFSLMMAGACEGLTQPERQIGVARFDTQVDYLQSPEKLPAALLGGHANKFLLGGPVNYSLISAILQKGGSAVYLSRFVEVPGVVSIVPDYACAARLAIEYLVAQGHRDIGVVAEHYYDREAYNTRELMHGVREGMALAGIPFKDDDVLFKAVSGPEKQSSVFPALLARRPRPTALFCFDDWTAKCMLNAAADAGLRVPQDISILGCNDDKTAAYLTPALSTVHLPTIEMGRQAVRELERLTRASSRGAAKRIVLPVNLVPRDSVAPNPRSS